MLVNTLTLKPSKASSYLKGKTPLETVVIGAGLSKTFGFPLATELLPRMIQWHASRGSRDSIRPILDFIHFFYPGFDTSTGQYPDAEDVMGMFDAVEEYSRLRHEGQKGFKWKGDIAVQLRIRFNKLLAQYLWSCHADMEVNNHAQLEPLRRFVRSKGPRVTYVTFNYDVLLEAALSLEGIPYSYRLERVGTGTVVLKPHGSINWFIRTSSKLFEGPLWAELGPNVSVFRGLNRSLIPFTDENWKQVAIIAPTPHKVFPLFELKKTWTAFSSSVHSARSLTAIGYSLPDADRVSRLVLNRAGPRHDPSRTITVVNPADVTRVYSQYISPSCTFIRKRFEEYA